MFHTITCSFQAEVEIEKKKNFWYLGCVVLFFVGKKTKLNKKGEIEPI